MAEISEKREKTVLSPLGNNLLTTPSNQQLQILFRQQVHVFEKTLLSNIIAKNCLRVSSDLPMEKCVKMDVFQLVFSISLANRFKAYEKEEHPQFRAELTSLDRIIEVFGCNSLVRRYRSGDFTVILPMHALLSDINISEQHTVHAGQLLIALESNDNSLKCLIPYGGSDPEAELPDDNSFCDTTIQTSQEKIWFPNCRGEGTLIVEKGYNFVYAPCNVIESGDVLLVRGIEYKVIGVSNDAFNQTRDVVRLNQAMNFNSKHCVYEIRKPVNILAYSINIPAQELKCIRKVKLDYNVKENNMFGVLELRFWNAAFNKMGILTHDIAVPPSEL